MRIEEDIIVTQTGAELMSIVPRTVEEIEVKYNGDKDGQDEIFIFRPGWLETIPSWRGSTNKNSIIYGLT